MKRRRVEMNIDTSNDNIFTETLASGQQNKNRLMQQFPIIDEIKSDNLLVSVSGDIREYRTIVFDSKSPQIITITLDLNALGKRRKMYILNQD